MLLYNSIRGVGALSQGFQAKKKGIRQVGFVPPRPPLYRGRGYIYIYIYIDARGIDEVGSSLGASKSGSLRASESGSLGTPKSDTHRDIRDT